MSKKRRKKGGLRVKPVTVYRPPALPTREEATRQAGLLGKVARATAAASLVVAVGCADNTTTESTRSGDSGTNSEIAISGPPPIMPDMEVEPDMDDLDHGEDYEIAISGPPPIMPDMEIEPDMDDVLEDPGEVLEDPEEDYEIAISGPPPLMPDMEIEPELADVETTDGQETDVDATDTGAGDAGTTD